jgi:hypothetical protein
VSSVTVHFPRYKLTDQLKQRGGKSVAAALRDADAGLTALAEPCLEIVKLTLARIDALVATLSPVLDEAALAQLYKESSSLIGLAATSGLRELDRVAYSLCDLLDRTLQTRCWDLEAIQVHAQALQLLSNPEVLRDRASVMAVLKGLKKVRDKFAAATEVQLDV